MGLSYPDLLTKCEEYFSSITISPEQSKNIEKHTRDQACSKIWFQQRGGQVTASRFKATACTNLAQPSQSLIKSICYPENQHFYTKQTSWGVCMRSLHIVHISVKEKLTKLVFVMDPVALFCTPLIHSWELLLMV